MNRNTESHFSELPQVDIERSIFDRSASHKTSFNVGDLIPFFVDEVLPGDTFKITTSCVVRLQTPLTPIMDNIYMDTYFFFVPNRLVWSHWKEFMGENTSSAWIPQTEYNIPQLINPAEGFAVGSIADYLGVPPKVANTDANPCWNPIALPFRGYALICNEWFRDQNLTDPINLYVGDANQNGYPYLNGDYKITVPVGGAPFKVAKYHDYFTSALPAPQKGPSIGLFPTSGQSVGNQGIYVNHWAPVYTRSVSGLNSAYSYPALKIKHTNSSDSKYLASSGQYVMYASTSETPTEALPYRYVPENLWADLSASGININEIRQAFQLQKFYEKNARAGTRYRELLKEHFGVTSSDARMQIPEYLGGHRFPLSIHQVANQSQGDNDFLGDLGAMSNTSDVHDDFVRSFEEHGFVIGVCCVRYDHSYPQGLERFWMRRTKLDYYFPVFANLGEQRVLKDEIYWKGHPVDEPVKDYTFGYQEAWADYRYKPSRISGEMRPGVPNSLASWHLADYYEDRPTLSDAWIREDKTNVDRVLSVQSSNANQVFADFYVKNIATRPMPMYSIPGLIDHH